MTCRRQRNRCDDGCDCEAWRTILLSVLLLRLLAKGPGQAREGGMTSGRAPSHCPIVVLYKRRIQVLCAQRTTEYPATSTLTLLNGVLPPSTQLRGGGRSRPVRIPRFIFEFRFVCQRTWHALLSTTLLHVSVKERSRSSNQGPWPILTRHPVPGALYPTSAASFATRLDSQATTTTTTTYLSVQCFSIR